MTQNQIHNLAMSILLDTQDSQQGLIWTTDWSQGDDGIDILNDQGQRMLSRITQQIIDTLNQ
jgi:hypothetical protein